MSCISTYITQDGTKSILYSQLIEQFGQLQGEAMYLNSKRYNWKSKDLNFQNEPSIENLITDGFTSKQKTTIKDTVDNLNDSAKNVDFNEEVHKYHVDGKELTSTSAKVDKYVPYTESLTEYDYSKEGTRTHAMFEKTILGASMLDIINQFSPTNAEIDLINQIQETVVIE